MHVAQVNIAKMKGPIDGPIMADFVANLEPINALADQSEGFVWRLTGDEDNATAIKVFEDDMLIINMSVWESREHLFQYVYDSGHMEVVRRKKEWFHHMKEMHMALWFVPVGHIPTPAEARERLEYLQKNGESAYAFSFKGKYTPKDL